MFSSQLIRIKLLRFDRDKIISYELYNLGVDDLPLTGSVRKLVEIRVIADLDISIVEKIRLVRLVSKFVLHKID